MSGILDNKQRVIDTLVTLEGRRQIASGKLKVEFVSFTDSATYYKADVVSGSADATTRIYLEACHLPQDQVTFEADDSGRLLPFKNTEGISVCDGQIVQCTFDESMGTVLTGSSTGMTFMNGEEFASPAQSLLMSSPDNFGNFRIIGKHAPIFEDDGFGIGNDSLTFVMTNTSPVPDSSLRTVNLTDVESLFNDPRLSRLVNFRYLPPINKVTEGSKPRLLGNFRPWGKSRSSLSGEQLESELAHFERVGCCKTISFDPTSRNNRLVAQFFEINNDSLKKLDVIEFGKYIINGSTRHAFFVGKVMLDGNGTHTFVHIFTLVFQ